MNEPVFESNYPKITKFRSFQQSRLQCLLGITDLFLAFALRISCKLFTLTKQ